MIRSGLPIIISILAALGVGTITAAFIARWNSVSQLRQAWVDGLRKEIAEFYNAVEKLNEAVVGRSAASLEVRECRDQALYVYRQIYLRLNMKEASHRRLEKSLNNLLMIGNLDYSKNIDYAISLSRVVLKEEWNRTEYGPLINIAMSVKRRKHRKQVRRKWKRRRRN